MRCSSRGIQKRKRVYGLYFLYRSSSRVCHAYQDDKQRGEEERGTESEGEAVVDDASRSDGQSSGVKDAVCSRWTRWDTHTAVCFPAMLG